MTDVEPNWDRIGAPSDDAVTTLRAELERNESALASAMAENEALQTDLTDQTRRLERDLVETREELDEWCGRASRAERVVDAAKAVVDRYAQGNEMATHAAIPGLREALDGGT